jgi:hypothetical protein
VFAFNLPELCEHFELEGIQPRHYLFDWFMTFFTRVFDDLSISKRILDFYMLDGTLVLFKASIAILKLLSEASLDMWGEMD